MFTEWSSYSLLSYDWEREAADATYRRNVSNGVLGLLIERARRQAKEAQEAAVERMRKALEAQEERSNTDVLQLAKKFEGLYGAN